MKFTIVSLFTILLLSFTLISCGNSSEEPKNLLPTKQLTTDLYGNTNFVFPELTDEAKIEVSHWGAYEDFDTEVKSINGNNVEELQIRTSQLVSHIDSLTKKIPDTLNTHAISSRVIVVKTRSELLAQEVNKSRIDSLQLQNYFDEMNTSVKNLIVQINEKFQKDAIDLQRITNEKQELEKQKRFIDSVYQIELQDKKSNNP
jgi:hypothetical protein